MAGKEKEAVESYLLKTGTELNNLMAAGLFSEFGRCLLERCISSLTMLSWDLRHTQGRGPGRNLISETLERR